MTYSLTIHCNHQTGRSLCAARLTTNGTDPQKLNTIAQQHGWHNHHCPTHANTGGRP